MRRGLFRTAGAVALAAAAVLMLPDRAPAQRRILGRLGRRSPVVYTVPGPTTYYYAVRPAPTGVVITYTAGYPGASYVPGPDTAPPADAPPSSPPGAPAAASPAGEPAGADTAVLKLRLP